MSVPVEGRGRARVCASGGYRAEWDDGRCDLAWSAAAAQFETALPTPLARGSRRLRRLAVRHMRRGALRQLLGGAVSELERDQEFADLTLGDVSVAEVIAMLEQQPAGLRPWSQP